MTEERDDYLLLTKVRLQRGESTEETGSNPAGLLPLSKVCVFFILFYFFMVSECGSFMSNQNLSNV